MSLLKKKLDRIWNTRRIADPLKIAKWKMELKPTYLIVKPIRKGGK